MAGPKPEKLADFARRCWKNAYKPVTVATYQDWSHPFFAGFYRAKIYWREECYRIRKTLDFQVGDIVTGKDDLAGLGPDSSDRSRIPIQYFLSVAGDTSKWQSVDELQCLSTVLFNNRGTSPAAYGPVRSVSDESSMNIWEMRTKRYHLRSEIHKKLAVDSWENESSCLMPREGYGV